MIQVRFGVLPLLMAAAFVSTSGSAAVSRNGTGEKLTTSQQAEWVRNPNDPIFHGHGNSFAADPYVWMQSPGHYRMVYTDSANDHQVIAMATSTDLVHWRPISDSQYPNGVILQGAGPGGQDGYLETATFRKTEDGKYQVFYIGYSNESTYHSAIYEAEATNMDGPYTREAKPVISWTPKGADAQSMTSPTIVEYQGKLYMTYVGWASFPNGPVTIMGATSTTDGRSWNKVGPLSWDNIFGVEADTEKGPDGLFYRVGITSDAQGNDVISLGRASQPFGPYTVLPEPILVRGGPSVGEGNTIMSPSLLFVPGQSTAYLYYAAVDTGGWPWVTSLATGDPLLPFAGTSPPVAPLISNLVVNDKSNAVDWSIRSNLQDGDRLYADRSYAIASLPAGFAGSTWIRPANDSKLYRRSPLVSFKVTANSTVYVVHSDAVAPPSWLRGWTNTGAKLITNQPDTYSIYSKPYAAGAKVSLGSNANAYNPHNTYAVVVEPATATP